MKLNWRNKLKGLTYRHAGTVLKTRLEIPFINFSQFHSPGEGTNNQKENIKVHKHDGETVYRRTNRLIDQDK